MRTIPFILIACLFFGACANKQPAIAQQMPKMPQLTDDELFKLVQKNTFEYFWSGAEPNSGLACERVHLDGVYPDNDQHVVTTGGSGFGLMAILVGIERGFITRQQGYERLNHIADWLEKADRFHGAWPHWMDGRTGKVVPFGREDNGGDLVETSFMAQGLLCVRQFFKDGNAEEKALAEKMDKLWKAIDWDWYRGPKKENVLFWHWSPDFAWKINFRIHGYNECLITYVLAGCSPTHGVPAAVYHEGWAESGKIKDGPTAYGHKLALKHQGREVSGGPLFWAHYSFLGLDPRKLKDKYADYWEHNVNHTLINYDHCVANPHHFYGYGPNCWGLTASYSTRFYAAHCPEEDLGVISPTAALSSFPYTPKQSMAAMRHFHDVLGDSLFGKYGFYDAFSQHVDFFPRRYLAIDQGPIVVMMENQRTGLIWRLFMSCPEVQDGLTKLGFEWQ